TSPRTGPLGPPVRSPQRAVTGSRAPSAGTPAPFSGGIGASFLADRSDLCHIHRSNPDEGVIVEPKHPPQAQLDAPPVAPLALRACGGSDENEETTGGDDYEPGSASLQVEIAPEIEGVNYPEDYVGPRARELEPFGDGETEFSMLTQTDPGMDFTTNYYS